MSDHCCIEEQILTDPCQALADGVLNYKNFVSYGFTPSQFAILVAQCETAAASGGGAPTTHTIATGTEAAPPAAGPYHSWLVVRTGGTGDLTVDGINLASTGASTAEEAQPGYRVPAPVIVVAVDATYEWRTKS